MINEMTAEEARRILIDIADQMPSDVCADWIDAVGIGIKAIDAQLMRDATEEERKSVKDYIESISKPTGLQFEAQSCEDCISRAYIKPIIEELEYDQIDNDYVLSLLSDIKNAPSVNPQRPKGKWIKTEGSFKCSECLIFPEYIRTLNYCPSCGSYNGGEEDVRIYKKRN